MILIKKDFTSFTLLLFVFIMISGCNAGEDSNAQTQSEPEVQLYSVGDFAGSHILVSYEGAARADDSISRSKEEALEKANELAARLQVAPDLFEEMARSESDGPSGPNGGDLGSWSKGQMVPEFDTAVEQLEIGAITEEPVETDFGYHIIRRNETEQIPHYSADGFVVAFQGDRVPPAVTRDSAAAKELADSLQEVIDASNYEALANEYNDFDEGPTPFPVFTDQSQAPLPGLADTLKNLAFGEVAGPIEIPVGYVFVRRLEVDKRAGSHILIAYQGAQNASPDVTISKEEALEEARRITALAKENPDQFAELAMEHSDGPTGPNGGDLGSWFKGRMVPEFDNAIDDLEPGEITDEPVETDYGYHIIKRNAL